MTEPMPADEAEQVASTSRAYRTRGIWWWSPILITGGFAAGFLIYAGVSDDSTAARVFATVMGVLMFVRATVKCCGFGNEE
jgi:hypothetical protein